VKIVGCDFTHALPAGLPTHRALAMSGLATTLTLGGSCRGGLTPHIRKKRECVGHAASKTYMVCRNESTAPFFLSKLDN